MAFVAAKGTAVFGESSGGDGAKSVQPLESLFADPRKVSVSTEGAELRLRTPMFIPPTPYCVSPVAP